MDLLLVSSEFVSHYVYIKGFNRFMFNKTKHKGKKYFVNGLQCFSSENVLIEHKEDCLVINGKQNVKLEKGFISFKNYSKQISVTFKTYADFECILKSVNTVNTDIINNDISYKKKCQGHIPCSFAYKVVCVDNKYSKKIVLYRGKDTVSKFIKSILNDYRRIMRKYFNKNLIMSAEENERSEMTNIFWICGGLIENTDNRVRDHCM